MTIHLRVLAYTACGKLGRDPRVQTCSDPDLVTCRECRRELERAIRRVA